MASCTFNPVESEASLIWFFHTMTNISPKYKKYIEFQDLRNLLSNFRNCEFVFAQSFEQNQKIGCPIKTVLELGVYKIPLAPEPFDYLPGQSTRTLFVLHKYFNFRKMVSVDIDDCQSTIDNCKKWCLERNIVLPKHEFIQCNSVEYDVTADFPNGIDFIFLDTNHDDDYPQRLGYTNSSGAGMTYKEISHLAPHLSINGRLFLHDTKNFFVEKRYGWNTMGAIERFLDENHDYYFIEHNANSNGLGEIMRKDSDIAPLNLKN